MKRMSNVISWRKPKGKKVMEFVAVVFVLVLAVLTLPTTTWAAETFHFKFQGQRAEAFFFSMDLSGCIFTNVEVSAGDNSDIFLDSPGPPSSSSASQANITISQFDICMLMPLLFATCPDPFAPLAEDDFQVIGIKLDSARLNTTLECLDFLSLSSFNVNVDLDWTGAGDLSRQNDNSHFHSPGDIGHFRGTSTSRFAEASGMVSDGATNFTPNPSDFAQILSVKSGQGTIIK